VPLADVLRIEQLPLSRIEYIGYRPVLNFEGQLLPVEDSGGVLAAAQGDPEAQIIVVVCREGNRHVGIAVSHVLDVAAGGDLFEAGTSAAHRRRDAAEESRDRRGGSGWRGTAACR
jgi:two-component system, chemotaxis family, sensor kinase CheA